MAAVVLVDLAVETAGKAALGSEVDHDLKFHALLDKLDGEARTRSSMRSLRGSSRCRCRSCPEPP
jgi:hypothetical protein